MPSISSMLPDYGCTEQEAINRAFHMANFDSIAHLPTDLRYTEVPRHSPQYFQPRSMGGAAIHDCFGGFPACSDRDPATFKVSKARKAGMERARTMTVAPTDGKYAPHAVTKNGLFSEFEYVPSEYNLYDMLESKARNESKAKMAAVGDSLAACSLNASLHS